MRLIKAIVDTISLFVMRYRNIRVYSLNGGLGDVFQLIDYIANKPNTNLSTVVYYLDANHEKDPKNFSYNFSRSYTSHNGLQINPTEEFLSFFVENKTIDCAIGKDLKNKTYGVRLYCELINKTAPLLNKSVLSDFLYTDTKILSKRLGLNPKKTLISVHLRRNTEEIMKIVICLNSLIPEKFQFLILGSSEHQIIPVLPDDIDHISLVDSYSKDLSLRDVLSLSCNANFFIGGRGGFEYFHLRVGVPSITIFDEEGFGEIDRGWWSEGLWEINRKSLLLKKEFDNAELLEHIVSHLHG